MRSYKQIWILFGPSYLESKDQEIRVFGLCEREIGALNLCKVSQWNELIKSSNPIRVVRIAWSLNVG